MGIELSAARRTIAWLRIQRYMQKDPGYKAEWFARFRESVDLITESVKNAVSEGSNTTELDVKAPVPDGMNPVEVGTVFVWRAQLAAQERLGRMLDSGELVRPVSFGADQP